MIKYWYLLNTIQIHYLVNTICSVACSIQYNYNTIRQKMYCICIRTALRNGGGNDNEHLCRFDHGYLTMLCVNRFIPMGSASDRISGCYIILTYCWDLLNSGTRIPAIFGSLCRSHEAKPQVGCGSESGFNWHIYDVTDVSVIADSVTTVQFRSIRRPCDTVTSLTKWKFRHLAFGGVTRTRFRQVLDWGWIF